MAHFDNRIEAMDGKAMVVCMSRRICIDLYCELVRLRPDWHDDGDDGGALKVVMTGAAADPPDWQPHIRNKAAARGAGETVPATPATRCGWCWCAICGSPASRAEPGTRCTWTSRCVATG